MDLFYPNKNEVMLFFKSRSGFIKVHRIAEHIVASKHNNVQKEEIEHVKGFLQQLKAEGFLLIENEGQDIYHEGFSSTPDRVAKYFAQFETKDYSDLTKLNEEELREIIRRHENAHISDSLYNRASQELELRHTDRVESFMRSYNEETGSRGKTVKQRYKDKDVFIESRSQGGDEHLLIGKRDGSGEKAHVIVDEENASIRLENGRQEPMDIVPHIETTITLPDGRKIVSTRGIISPAQNLPKVEVEKIGFNKIVTTREGLAESFTIILPILIKNSSENKVLVRNVRPSFELPSGYQWHFTDNLNSPSGRDIPGKDFLPFNLIFSSNIKGREKGVNDQNPEYVANRDLILDQIESAKFIFHLSLEIVTLEGTSTIEESVDLTDELLPKILDKK